MDASSNGASAPARKDMVMASTKHREREERARRLRDEAEKERERKKHELEAAAAREAKLRAERSEQRRKHFEELRAKEIERKKGVEERRKQMEQQEMVRRKAILSKFKEATDSRNLKARDKPVYAFGSSTPRKVAYLDPDVQADRSVSVANLSHRRSNISSSSPSPDLFGNSGKPTSGAAVRSHRTRTVDPMTSSVAVGKRSGIAGVTSSDFSFASMTASYSAAESGKVNNVRRVATRRPLGSSKSRRQTAASSSANTGNGEVQGASHKENKPPMKTADSFKKPPAPPRTGGQRSTSALRSPTGAQGASARKLSDEKRDAKKMPQSTSPRSAAKPVNASHSDVTGPKKGPTPAAGTGRGRGTKVGGVDKEKVAAKNGIIKPGGVSRTATAGSSSVSTSESADSGLVQDGSGLSAGDSRPDSASLMPSSTPSPTVPSLPTDETTKSQGQQPEPGAQEPASPTATETAAALVVTTALLNDSFGSVEDALSPSHSMSAPSDDSMITVLDRSEISTAASQADEAGGIISSRVSGGDLGLDQSVTDALSDSLSGPGTVTTTNADNLLMALEPPQPTPVKSVGSDSGDEEDFRNDPANLGIEGSPAVSDDQAGSIMSHTPTPTGKTGKILTAEEAKSALAEKRRIAREKLEQEREMERQRIAREEAEEATRIKEEEELFKREEGEAMEAAEQARTAEEERLKQAIEEAEKVKQAEAEKAEREREEREKQEVKAAEEAQKLERERAEREERLRREEEERMARKKKLDAIMERTRKTPAKTESTSKSTVASNLIMSTSVSGENFTSVINGGSPVPASSPVAGPIESGAGGSPSHPSIDHAKAIGSNDIMTRSLMAGESGTTLEDLLSSNAGDATYNSPVTTATAGSHRSETRKSVQDILSRVRGRAVAKSSTDLSAAGHSTESSPNVAEAAVATSGPVSFSIADGGVPSSDTANGHHPDHDTNIKQVNDAFDPFAPLGSSELEQLPGKPQEPSAVDFSDPSKQSSSEIPWQPTASKTGSSAAMPDGLIQLNGEQHLNSISSDVLLPRSSSPEEVNDQEAAIASHPVSTGSSRSSKDTTHWDDRRSLLSGEDLIGEGGKMDSTLYVTCQSEADIDAHNATIESAQFVASPPSADSLKATNNNLERLAGSP